jgi:hypothetical protein
MTRLSLCLAPASARPGRRYVGSALLSDAQRRRLGLMSVCSLPRAPTRIPTKEIDSSATPMNSAHGLIGDVSVGLNAIAPLKER